MQTLPPAPSLFPHSFSASVEAHMQKAQCKPQMLTRSPTGMERSFLLMVTDEPASHGRPALPLEPRCRSQGIQASPSLPAAKQSPRLSSFLFLPTIFPRCCLQGERGQCRQNEGFSCMPSPSSGPNSFFMAPRSDKSRCFSLVSVRRAISQS